MKETRNLELKSEITNTFLKTVSAFANYDGGKVIFGIDDKGDTVGVDNPDRKCLDIENRINDSISPKPEYSLNVNYEDNTITLAVEAGQNKPYMYKGKAYRRNDTASIEVDSLQLRALVLEGSNISFESLECNQDRLTFNELELVLKEKLGVSDLTEDMLRTLGFFTKEKRYNNAAALFADNNEFYGVDIARFGNSISEILDRETIAGVSVFTMYDKAIEMYKRYYQYDEIKTIVRTTVELIPEQAYREALANALIHRRWDMNSHIRIEMFADRIEIKSPGGLPSGIKDYEFLYGDISSLRNPIEGNLFFRLNYIEMFGTGVRRILESYSDSVIKPEFKITENTISVILPVLKDHYEVSSNERVIINVMKSGDIYTSNEISIETGFNKAKVIRLVNALIEKKYIVAVGKGRGTKYKLNK